LQIVADSTLRVSAHFAERMTRQSAAMHNVIVNNNENTMAANKGLPQAMASNHL